MTGWQWQRCTPECANFARLRDPKSNAETVRHMQEFDRMHGVDSRQKLSKYGDSRKRFSDDRGTFLMMVLGIEGKVLRSRHRSLLV